MVMQFEWTTRNPGAIPPRCRSLIYKLLSSPSTSLSSTATSTINIINVNIHIFTVTVNNKWLSDSIPEKIVNILSTGSSLLIDVAERKDPWHKHEEWLRSWFFFSPRTAPISVNFGPCFKCEPGSGKLFKILKSMVGDFLLNLWTSPMSRSSRREYLVWKHHILINQRKNPHPSVKVLLKKGARQSVLIHT